MSDEAMFDAHCLALGRLCVAWAEFDRNITNLASVLIGQGPEITACLFPGSENLKPRCESIKKLVAFAPPGGRPEWRDGITAIVSRAMMELASQRNRYIHDLWMDGSEGVVRLDTTTRLRRPQSHAAHEVVFGTWYQDETPLIVDLTIELDRITEQLLMIVVTIADHQREGRPLGQFPQPPPPAGPN